MAFHAQHKGNRKDFFCVYMSYRVSTASQCENRSIYLIFAVNGNEAAIAAAIVEFQDCILIFFCLWWHTSPLISQHIVQPLKIRSKNTKMSISHRNASSCCHTFWKYFPFSKVKAYFWSFPQKNSYCHSKLGRHVYIFSKCDLTYRRTHTWKR